MLTRKSKKFIIIGIIAIIVIIITIALVLLYINTDYFKPSETLFMKYMGQNTESLQEVYKTAIQPSSYDEQLAQNKYTTQTKIKINQVENVGTSMESTQNSINRLKLEINEQTDKSNQYDYKDIKLLDNNEDVTQMEYIQNQNIYGVHFNDLFNQYILVEDESLEEAFSKAGFSEEEIIKIPNGEEYAKAFQFSEQEIQEEKDKYLQILKSNINKDNFSKQRNVAIQINENNLNANAYTLTLTKEQFYSLYIKILETLKQDETIMLRIDKLEEMENNFRKIYGGTEQTTGREKFQEEISERITELEKNNIGQEEVKITVYESNEITVKTTIQTPDYEVNLDILQNQEKPFVELSYKNSSQEKEKVLTYEQTEEEKTINYQNKEKEEVKQYSLEISENVESNIHNKNITAKYQDESNRVEANIEQAIQLVNQFEKEITFDDSNSINLSKLEGEQETQILDQIKQGVTNRIEEIKASHFNIEDLKSILETAGLVKKQEVIEVKGITEAEKNRFNSKFELLGGEGLDSDNILNVIEAIKDNFVEIEVVSNNEVKLKIDRTQKNDDVVETLKNFIEENQDKIYNVTIEYDETTGLVSDLLLTILEKTN